MNEMHPTPPPKTITLPTSVGDALAHIAHKGGYVGIGVSIVSAFLEAYGVDLGVPNTDTGTEWQFLVTGALSFGAWLKGHLHLRDRK